MARPLDDGDLDSGPPPRRDGGARDGRDGGRRDGGGRRGGGPPTATADHIEAFERLFPTASAVTMTRLLENKFVLAALDRAIADQGQDDWAAETIDKLEGDRLLTKVEIAYYLNRSFPALRDKNYEEVVMRILNARPATEGALPAVAATAVKDVCGVFGMVKLTAPWWVRWPLAFVLWPFRNLFGVFGKGVAGLVVLVISIIILWPMISTFLGTSPLDLFKGFPKGAFFKSPSDPAPEVKESIDAFQVPGVNQNAIGEALAPLSGYDASAGYTNQPQPWEVPDFSVPRSYDSSGSAGYSQPTKPGGKKITRPGDVKNLPR